MKIFRTRTYMKMAVDMEEFKNAMRKRFSFQHRGKNIIGSIAMNEIKTYLNIKDVDNEENSIITWYVKNEKLFVKILDQQLKIKVFQEKRQILSNINSKLLQVWYSIQIKDVFFK